MRIKGKLQVTRACPLTKAKKITWKKKGDILKGKRKMEGLSIIKWIYSIKVL